MNEDDYKKKLDPMQYQVLRQKATEPPFTGKLLYNDENGQYKCAACGQVLFDSTTKFDAGTGWPSFYDAKPGTVNFTPDHSHGMERTEVTCSKCGSHLGHVFTAEGKSPTGQYFCINSCALDFDKAKQT